MTTEPLHRFGTCHACGHEIDFLKDSWVQDDQGHLCLNCAAPNYEEYDDPDGGMYAIVIGFFCFVLFLLVIGVIIVRSLAVAPH